MGDKFEDGKRAYENDQLNRHCFSQGNDYWAFERVGVDIYGGTSAIYTREQALGIIRAFGGLGLSPRSKISMDVIVALYDRIVAVEKDLQHSRLKC